MHKPLVLVLAFALGGCAAAQQRSTTPDPEQSKELEAFVREMFARMDAGDFAFMKDSACPKVVLFDTNEQGLPVSAYGKDETDKLFDHYRQVMPAGSVKSDVTRIECKSAGGRGVCTIEFDQRMTMGGETAGPFKLRGTLSAKLRKDKWIWDHWHGSLRELPAEMIAAMQAAAAPAEPAPAAAAAAPATPAPATPAPATPAPATPTPSTPAPATPAPASP